MTTLEILKQAKAASPSLAMLNTEQKNAALLAMANALENETEAILGKTLTSTDISTVISLYDWAGIPADVILMVVAHCASLDKRNLRYIERPR